MPGDSESYDLIRVKDGRSNSKADTFFIAPKGLGNEDFQVKGLFLQALAGDITGNTELTDLVGDNLSVDGSGSLNASTDVPDDLDVKSIVTVTLEVDTITDGADVSHSGELADAADVSSIQSSNDVTVTDTQAGTVSDQEFLKNEGGNLTGASPPTFALDDLARENALYLVTNFRSLDGFVQTTSGAASINILPGAVRLDVDPDPDFANLRDRLDYPSATATWDKDHTFSTAFFKEGASSQPTVTVGMGEWSDTTEEGFAFERRGGDLYGKTSGAETQLISGVSNEVQLRAEFTAGSKVEYYVDGTKEGEVTSGLPTGTTEADTLFSFFVVGGPDFSSKTFISEFKGVQHT